MIRILGLDPGTRITGYGCIDFEPETRAVTYVECGTLETSAPDMRGKLEDLRKDAVELVREFKPAVGVLERAHIGKGPHAGLRLSEARGVLLAVLGEAGVDVAEYQPKSVKLSITAHGGASKEAVRGRVMRMLRLTTAPTLDSSDALALALCWAVRWRPRK